MTKPKASLKMVQVPEKTFEVEAEDRMITIEDGVQLLKDLRKEARRQKAMRAAEDLEEQAKEIEHVPSIPSVQEEIALADDFDIIEE
jgi:hypothetical protein